MQILAKLDKLIKPLSQTKVSVFKCYLHIDIQKRAMNFSMCRLLGHVIPHTKYGNTQMVRNPLLQGSGLNYPLFWMHIAQYLLLWFLQVYLLQLV